MKRALLKNHETKYIKSQGNFPSHIGGYKIQGTSGNVVRKGSPDNKEDYVVIPELKFNGNHLWSGPGYRWE